MTKDEFIASVPNTIEHPKWGHGTLEIVADTLLKKAALYRHLDNMTSCLSFGSNWQQVYEEMKLHLRRSSSMDPSKN